MDFLLKWVALAGVQTVATMSPGPAFVMCVRNAVTYNRKAALFTALGLGAGVGAHVLFVMCGLAFLIAHSVVAYNVIKYAGAAYLIYVGLKALKAKKREEVSDAHIIASAEKSKISNWKAFMMGVMTNLLNPKAVLFFTAVYTQFIDEQTPLNTHVLYGVTSVAIEALWFSMVAIVLTHPEIKRRFLAIVHWIERCCGGLMIGLGLKLALSR